MVELRRLIAGSYGREDFIFAGHANDAESARKAIVEAGNQKIGLIEFLNSIGNIYKTVSVQLNILKSS